MSERWTREQVEEFLPLYVLDEVADDERRAIEQALRADEDLARLADDLRNELGGVLAESSEPVRLSDADLDRMTGELMARLEPPALSDRVGDAASRPEPLPVPSTAGERSWVSALALAASLLAVLLAAWALRGGGSGTAEELERLQAENAALASQMDELRAALRRNDQTIERVSASLRTLGYPRSTPIVLAGLDPAPDATGATFYRPSAREALFYAFGLPQLDEDSVYQLWFIPDGGDPVSAGTFSVDENGEGSVVVADVPEGDEISLWAVTLEPEGGSPQPTGPMLIRG